jgi:HK97 family phage major capsid protein
MDSIGTSRQARRPYGITHMSQATPALVLEEVRKYKAENSELKAADEARQKELAEVKKDLADLKEKTAQPQYPAGVTPNYMAQIGSLPGDSRGYSIIKAARLALGQIEKADAKYEYDVNEKLKELYKRQGCHLFIGNRSWLVPYCARNVPMESDADHRLVGELRQKMVADADKVDPDEARYIEKRLGVMRTKDFGTTSDTAGGVLVGFPTLMELIDIQRNMEVFAQAGATEQALPANGRMQYPKLTNTTTAFWVGEGATITESTPATGYLDLQAKKLGILVDLNNELIRFASITAEAMVRSDMAKVAALKADLAMLEGTGGTQIKGLITYDSAATWVTGQDKLLTHSVTANTFQIADAADMEAKLPDTAGEPTAWLMRRQLWAKIRNRRASAAITTDLQGPFLTNITRSAAQSIPLEFEGVKVVRSTQVSATRGSGSNTYVLLGNFRDWIVARFGVLEFLSSNVSDDALTKDLTRLRCIQHLDAGPRHASSFVFADDVSIA